MDKKRWSKSRKTVVVPDCFLFISSLKERHFGGRYNETCYLPFMRQSVCEIWEEQIRIPEVAMQQLLDDHNAKDRQYLKAASDLPEVAV